MVKILAVKAGVVGAIFGMLALSTGIVAADKDPIVKEKSYDARVDQVYAAMVQSANRTLKNSVKEACMVNFETGESSATNIGQFYRRSHWTATCHDLGDGKTSVTLHEQTQTNQFGTGRFVKKEAAVFWSNLDIEVARVQKSVVETSSSPNDLAIVSVRSTPAGAEVTADGNFSGSAPATLRLPPGNHTIKVALKGFQDWQRSLTVTPGGSATLNAVLEGRE